MAQLLAPVKCPSCGSTNVVVIPLFLIQTRYYQCQGCPATFREIGQADGPPDFDRITQDMLVPATRKPQA